MGKLIKLGCGLAAAVVAGFVMLMICAGLLMSGDALRTAGTEPADPPQHEDADGTGSKADSQDAAPEPQQGSVLGADAPPKPKEFAIDNWRATSDDDRLAYYVALRMFQGRDDEPVANEIMSIGRLNKPCIVIQVPEEGTLLVDFGRFADGLAFVTKINTTGVVDGDERQINGLATYTGVVRYTSVLGAVNSVHSYRMIDGHVKAEADRIYEMMRDKQKTLDAREAQAQRELLERQAMKQALREMIVAMSQSTRKNYEHSVREAIAENMFKHLARLSENTSTWDAADAAILAGVLDGLGAFGEAYTGDTSPEELRATLGDLLDRTDRLTP